MFFSNKKKYREFKVIFYGTSKDRPDLSYSSMLKATSQLSETIGSRSSVNSFRSATHSLSVARREESKGIKMSRGALRLRILDYRS